MYKRIRDLREERDLTQAQLAKFLNCNQRIYGNYERGDLDIPIDILVALAEFYDTNMDYILNLTDIKEPYPR